MATTAVISFVAVVLAVLEIRVSGEEPLKDCEIVKKLKEHGFPQHELGDWLCMILAESQGKTHEIGRCNRNGSREFGLFMINNDLWCSTGDKPGKLCNVKCNDLVGEDITKAAKCAKLIHSRRGFMNWYGWQTNCRNKENKESDISKC